jgi:small nuclear ribonucleoprotein (snRNP)-like protein
MQAVGSFFGNPLAVSIFVILVTSLVGFYVNSRVRDRCLRDFDGYQVVIEDKTGKVMWGALRTYSSGLELLYASARRDEVEGHIENSYILYDKDLVNVQAIYRFHDDQSEQNQRRRKAEIQRTYQPSLFRQAWRALRNLFSTFKDAIAQATNTVLGYRAAQNPQDVMLSKHKELTTSGVQLLSGTVGNAYEPILERYIGQYVVLETLQGSTVEQDYGILKEYSSKYLELLGVKVEVPPGVYFRDPAALDRVGIRTEQEGSHLRVTNSLGRTVVIEAIKCGEKVRAVNLLVPSKGTADIELLAQEVGNPISLDLGVRCLADVIVPRAVGVIRNAGQREKLGLDTLLGLDELPALPWMKRLIGETPQAIDLAHLTSSKKPQGEKLSPE